MAEAVRVRFAPSPTGLPHIGNIRTALFNWLFARHHGGKFIVRVEDTDQDRLVPGAVDAVLESLEWLHLDWDEGPRVGGPFAPYRQSERLDTYRRMAEQMIEKGRAYRCYCSEDRLLQMREEQQRLKRSSGYDRRCRHLDPEERRTLEADGGPSVIRFAMPLSGTTRVRDIIHGDVEWQNELLDDFVLLKSDGFPTYHLAVVVDDHLMEISHVLRAEEWLPSTPRHLQIYEALGFDPPRFGHLPMILGPDRSKLSKRHGATALLEYRDEGFLPEAVANFLLLLGWSLDDKTEIMGPEAAIEGFSLERVSRSAAIFDHDKLTWMNGVYIRQLSVEELADRLLPILQQGLPAVLPPVSRDQLLRIVPLIQQRTKLLSEAVDLTSYFFQAEVEYDPLNLVQKGMDRESALAALGAAKEGLAKVAQFEHEAMEELLRAEASRLGLSARQFFGTLRVAATGRETSPPLFETMEVLGRQRVLARVGSAIERLNAVPH
ncbi:MAG: glutamate--tRNA ligase [Dehalococcoidia bacterium]|nr:glutamate--tRNA ligase [Dehalococcoidia bacterium]HJN88443.1 glutamate--tRNA ligase [Dehalococcoidia bacterium]